jgi:hypothetical protein
MKVKVSKLVKYYKYAEVEVEVPNDIHNDKLCDWLIDNEDKYDEELDNKTHDSSLEYDDSETYRYETSDGFGGHL